jgi:hypothetical protein
MADEQNATPSPEEINDALTGVEDFEELRDLPPEAHAGALRIIPYLVQRANTAAEAGYAKKLESTVSELKAANSKMIDTELDKMRAANKPPDPKEIEKLLTQEYQEFKVTVYERKGKNQREFVIREMPQATELKFLKIIQQRMVPHLKELSSVEWTSGTSMAEKLQRIIDIVPEALDMLAECCAISLDPYGDEGITKEWVQANLSSFRVMSIIESQIVAGRFRDFFSALSRSIPGQTTA